MFTTNLVGYLKQFWVFWAPASATCIWIVSQGGYGHKELSFSHNQMKSITQVTSLSYQGPNNKRSQILLSN